MGVMEVDSIVLTPSNSAEYGLITRSTNGGIIARPGEGAFEYDERSIVTISAKTTDPNYIFMQWSGTAVEVGKVLNPNSIETTVLVDDIYTVVANFQVDFNKVR
jgi:hypothetical protein